MNLRIRSREEPEINLTPLIDVVLLLLVFFMVSSSFMRETTIGLRLPQARTEPSPSAVDTEVVEIAVAESGAYAVNGGPLADSDGAALRAAVEQFIGDNRDVSVHIRADARATHQAVVTAMNVAGQLGLIDIRIVTVAPPPER